MTTRTGAGTDGPKRRDRGEGSVPKLRVDGRWESKIRLPDGGRRSVYGKTKEECRQKLRAIRRQIEDDERPTDDSITFGQFATGWIERSGPKLRERTHKRYSDLLRLHAIPTLGRVKLSKLRAEQIDALLAAKDGTLSPRTCHHLRAVIRRVLQVAVTEKLIRTNEAALTDPPYVPDRPVRATEPEEARAILEAVRGDRYEALYVTALWSGCRQGELFALRWADVNLDVGRLRITRTLGLGRLPDGSPRFDEPKTQKSARTVRVREAATSVLREHRKRQLEARVFAGPAWQDLDLVFATSVGTPLDSSDVLKSFRRCLRAAGLPPWRFHDLRHAYATLSLAAGADLVEIRDALGHSTITLTSDTYTHVLERGRERGAERLEAFVMGTGS